MIYTQALDTLGHTIEFVAPEAGSYTAVLLNRRVQAVDVAVEIRLSPPKVAEPSFEVKLASRCRGKAAVHGRRCRPRQGTWEPRRREDAITEIRFRVEKRSVPGGMAMCGAVIKLGSPGAPRE